MKEIQLRGKHGAGKVALVDDEDFERLSKLSWWVGAKNGYAYTYIPGSHAETGKCINVYMHHLVLPDVPEGMARDHINGCRLDNRKGNLRVVSPSLNSRNRVASTTATASRYLGVARRHDGGWAASYRGSAFATKNGAHLTSTKGEHAEAYCALVRDVAAFVDQGVTAQTNFMLPVVLAFAAQLNGRA